MAADKNAKVAESKIMELPELKVQFYHTVALCHIKVFIMCIRHLNNLVLEV